MKELELPNQDKLEITAQQKQQKELKLVGQIKPHRGHTVFELNLVTNIITPAEFTQQDVTFGQAQLPNKRIIVKQDCIYLAALNETNARKKFNAAILKATYQKKP